MEKREKEAEKNVHAPSRLFPASWIICAMFWKFQLSFPSPAMTVQIAVFCGFALMRAAALTRLMPLSIPDCVRLPAAIDVIS